jgi:neutral ceramidase
MFPVGLARVTFTPTAGSARPALINAECPLVPQVVPMHLVRIGGVVLAGVPAEFTATAGRRLKQTLATAFGADMSHCAIAGYCNGYSGYVTTREEYAAQEYEGASTLYGEFTLMAYQQTFNALAGAINGGAGVASTPSFRVPLVVRTSGPVP